MIVSGVSEDKLLEELIADKINIAGVAKKLAKKTIMRLQKIGRGGKKEDLCYTYQIKTKIFRNTWRLVIYINMAKNPKWYHLAACCVESGQGTKDYYIVRGFSNDRPYYIKISSHAIKRFVERGVVERTGMEVPFNGIDFAPSIIRKGEVITWLKVSDPKYWKLVLHFEDNNDLTTLFYTSYGCYLGNVTERGNYEFKTFLNNDKELKKNGETETMLACKYTHIFLNESLYDRQYVRGLMDDELEEIKKDTIRYFKNKLMP